MTAFQTLTIEQDLAKLRNLGLNASYELSPDCIPPFLSKVRDLLVPEKLEEDSTVAIHATSFESLKLMLETGVLPTEVLAGRYNKGFVYFEPIPSVMEGNMTVSSALKPKALKEILDGAEEFQGYSAINAPIIARSHTFKRVLGLNAIDHDLNNITINLVAPDSREDERMGALSELEGFGFSREKILATLAYASHMHGVMVGFSADVFKEYPFSETASEEGAFRIQAPKGIKLEFLTGILPLGPVERKFAKQIQMR